MLTVSDGTNVFTCSYVRNRPNLVNRLVANPSTGSGPGGNGTSDIMTTTRTYDYLNRLTQTSSVGFQPAVSYTYDYNAANQGTKATLADGSYWPYTPPVNRLASPCGVRLGSFGGSLLTDDLGQVVGGVKKLSDGTPIPGMGFSYTFDHIGNRTQTDTAGLEADYTPNLLNQYTQRDVPGAIHIHGAANEGATVTVNLQGTTRQGEYYYKQLAVDNSTAPVLAEVNTVGVLKNAGPDNKDIVEQDARQLFVPQDPEPFTYDLDGNLLTDGQWTYTWNEENRLISMGSAVLGGNATRMEFTYDSQGRRIRKTIHTWDDQAQDWAEDTDTVFVWSDWLLLAELDANDGNAVVRTHTWGLDLSGGLQGARSTGSGPSAGGVGGLLASTDAAANTRAAAYDGNGNVTALVDLSDGTVVAEYEYSPFGKTLRATGPAVADNPFKFSTKYEDTGSGLYYYGARFYSPGLGRWLNRDPIGERGGRSLYAMLQNDLQQGTDMLGLKKTCRVLLWYGHQTVTYPKLDVKKYWTDSCTKHAVFTCNTHKYAPLVAKFPAGAFIDQPQFPFPLGWEGRRLRRTFPI